MLSVWSGAAVKHVAATCSAGTDAAAHAAAVEVLLAFIAEEEPRTTEQLDAVRRLLAACFM
jgi:hypothetical protein